MRNQYYGDARDVFKWSVILRLVRAHSIRSVLQVAMLRKDDRTKQGSVTDHPALVEEPVLRFFEAERQVYKSDPGLRDVRRVSRLPAHCGGGFDIRVFDKKFPRASYFEEVAAMVRSLPAPTLVFLDPDTGMGQGTGQQRSKQIRPAEVRAVFSSLRAGDVLVLFQYRWRRADWMDHLKEMFRKAVGGVPVDHTADSDLVLFCAVRTSG